MRCDMDTASLGPFVREALIQHWCAQADASNVVPFRMDDPVKRRPDREPTSGSPDNVVLFTGVRRERHG